MTLRRALVFPVLFSVACASTSADHSTKDVAQAVRERSGHRIPGTKGVESEAEIEKAIERLLANELTADAAVQIALLANPRLASRFEELSIGQADLVQAGLLSNPTFTIGRTAWESEHIDPNLFASVEQSFLDLVTLPMKKRVAETELEATKLEVGDAVLELAAQVRSAFYTAQAASQIVAMRRLIEGAARASAELAQHQYDAGNMNDLALRSELALASQTRLDLARSENDAAVSREQLNKLMGLWGKRTAWRTVPSLPILPKTEVPLERLESIAIEKRLDVGAARRAAQAIDSSLSLASATRWTGVINVQLQAGRLRDSGRLSFGPSVSLEIPLFDQRRASIARLEAYLRRAENNLRAVSIDVRADVRAAQSRVIMSRAIALEYQNVLVPLREAIVTFSQQQYDAMLLGVYQLLQAKQTEFATYREYVESLRDYWIARSDLERAIGTRLGNPEPSKEKKP